MKAPCKDCKDRNPMCHSTCENYIQFKKESDRIRDKRGKAVEKDRHFREIEDKRYKRMGYVCGEH